VPFRSIQDPSNLRRVLEATLLIEADIDLAALLRHVVEEARSMTGARYGALGVLSDDRTEFSEFITVGLEPHEEDRIGPRPTGQGVLGLLIADPRPLRLSNLGSHADSFGFPPNHPPMTSFLGVPIKLRDEVYGNLYLTDKIGWSEFTDDDVALIETLAVAAGIGIENARLHERDRIVAVYEDRNRLARDLHDTVIQRLFGVGLTLQSMATHSSVELADALASAVDEIDQVINQVRSTIYELGMGEKSRGIRDRVLALVRNLSYVVGFDVQVTFDGPIDTAIPDRVVEHLLATIQEAVADIGHHADATQASLNLSVRDGQCRLHVVDNGRWLRGPDQKGDFAVDSLLSRAEQLRGTFSVGEDTGGGCTLDWSVPIRT
jgi:signal transduction histidine kinase